LKEEKLDMTTTSNALDGLLFIRNGHPAGRWNFPDAVGTPFITPGGIGNAVSLSYSFPGSLPGYSSESGFLAFNDLQKQATRTLLSSIEALIDVDFNEIAGVGQLTFGMSSQPAGQGGFAYAPAFSYAYRSNIESVTELDTGGDVWINRNQSWVADAWIPGHDGYATLLHETGHALGLKHPFDGTYTLAASLDDESHTVMSYTRAPHSALIAVTGNQWSYSWLITHLRPSTLMPLDIEALQSLYGANTTTRTGNDIYHWSNNAEILETIWDAGGTDTIDCSNQTLTCIIDLRAGNYSSIGLRLTDAEKRLGLDLPVWFTAALPADIYNGSHNLAIAKGVVIEKALGGSGNDQLIGNTANNLLSGGGGNDSLSGGAGNDTLDGGAGIDALSGGDGSDTYYVRDINDLVSETSALASTGGTDYVRSYLAAYTLTANVENGRIVATGTANLTGNNLNNLLYAGSGNNVLDGSTGTDTVSYAYGVTGTTGVSVNLSKTSAQATGGSGTDTLLSIEKLIGSAYADKLTGNTVANRLTGNGGNDTLDGGAGIDTLSGGDGSDTYYVRDIGDLVSEANALASTGGTDQVHSYLAAYTLTANVENGRIRASDVANLTGNTLNNVLYAGSGNNVLDGSTGTDTVSYAYGVTGTTGVSVNLSKTSAQATGSSGADTLTSIENLTGSNYDDVLTGNTGANRLVGGLGKDILTGGAGNDVFDFNALTETGITIATRDVITDFARGQDRIDLSTIDANAATASVNDAFTAFIGSATTFSAAGQLKLVGNVLYGNTDTDSSAEFAIQLTGIGTLTMTDFIA
jgi:Ca2+-binding RTX toxin-like protein